MFFRASEPSSAKGNKLQVAIIGAGTGGLCAAISLLKKFGDRIEVFVFEKHTHFDLEKGVEQVVGPIFQLAMLELGMDIDKIRKSGYRLSEPASVRNTKFEVQRIETEVQDFHTDFYVNLPPENKKYQLCEYSVKHGVFMDFLHMELLRVNNNKKVIHFNCHLQKIVSTTDGKKKLIFLNNEATKEFDQEFDLVIGADGVNSQVRKLMFDQQPPHHVGVNVLYGVIPANIQEFEANKFHIVIGNKFTTTLNRFLELDKSISTWWAIIYPDGMNNDASNTAFWENRNDPHFIKRLACELAEKDDNPVLKRLISQTPDLNFKYSGKFLERNPLLLKEWGKDNVVLLGDAIHAMMPWASAGTGMAAEDVFVLASLFEKYKVFESRETFNKRLADNSFATLYEEFKKERVARVTYFYVGTHQMAPNGIMSADDFQLKKVDIRREYGNHHLLSSSPIFTKLLQEQLSSEEQRSYFFEDLVNSKEKKTLTEDSQLSSPRLN